MQAFGQQKVAQSSLTLVLQNKNKEYLTHGKGKQKI